MQDAHRNGKTTLTIRLEKDLRDELLATAAQNERTLSQELRRAIRWYVALQRQT